MKKKMIFVIDSLNSGGAEKSLVSLLSVLDYDMFDVDLLLFKKSGLYLPLINKAVNILEVPEYFNSDIKENLRNKIYKLRNSFLIRNPYYKKKFHGAQITCKNILNALPKQVRKYDIAIAYSQGLPTYYVAEKIESKKKLAWINTDYKKAGYNAKFDRKYYEKYDYIVPVSERTKEILEEIYPEFKDKMKVVFDIISPTLVKKMADEGIGYSDDFDGIRILTIGRHVYLKGYDLAIEAARLLKEKGVKFRWYSIGEGILTEELQNMVNEKGLSENFIFLGTYTNPYSFINQCDIYCQPSRFEGFGMAIAEAKILNKPIVATNFDVVYEQIENKKNGIITNMIPEDIFMGINKLLNNAELTERIIENLKNEVKKERFDLEYFYDAITN